MTRRRTGSKEDTLAANQRRERMESVVKLYLTGKSVLDIAKAHNVDRGRIYQDLRAARAIWRKRNDRSAEALISEEIAKIDRIEAAAWDGWEKSRQDAVEISEDTDVAGKKSNGKKTKGQSGNCAFLAQALACVDKRCKMLKIGEYATEESAKLAGIMVEIVVDSQEEIAEIMDYGDYKKLTAPSEN